MKTTNISHTVNSHFNEDGAKWEDSTQHDNGPWLHEPGWAENEPGQRTTVFLPFLLRDGSGDCVDSARIVWLARDVPAKDGPH